jgi:hypothetical protein
VRAQLTPLALVPYISGKLKCRQFFLSNFKRTVLRNKLRTIFLRWKISVDVVLGIFQSAPLCCTVPKLILEILRFSFQNSFKTLSPIVFHFLLFYFIFTYSTVQYATYQIESGRRVWYFREHCCQHCLPQGPRGRPWGQQRPKVGRHFFFLLSYSCAP